MLYKLKPLEWQKDGSTHFVVFMGVVLSVIQCPKTGKYRYCLSNLMKRPEIEDGFDTLQDAKLFALAMLKQELKNYMKEINA